MAVRLSTLCTRHHYAAACPFEITCHLHFKNGEYMEGFSQGNVSYQAFGVEFIELFQNYCTKT
jgi:hypothetical protein